MIDKIIPWISACGPQNMHQLYLVFFFFFFYCGKLLIIGLKQWVSVNTVLIRRVIIIIRLMMVICLVLQRYFIPVFT